MNTLKFVFFSSVLATLISCGNAEHKDVDTTATETETTAATTDEAKNLGHIEFSESAFDFGQVKEGEVIEHVYTYTNTGKSPVILSQVSASCGCTTPSYTQTPTLPGKSGEVKVSFDTNGQVGKQEKIVTIVSNAENRVTTVRLKGEVLPK